MTVKKMEIYEFLYCSSVHESSYATLSLHRTKAGAYKALKAHKLDTFMEWYENRITYGKYSRFNYDAFKDWTIGKQILLD